MEQRGKLTKKYFMQIPEGRYLVSNCYLNMMQSVFEEYVCSPEKRNDQWQRIVEAGASQRLCHHYDDKSEYKKRLSQINYNVSKNKRKTVH